MIKIIAGVAAAGVMSVMLMGPGQAQERQFRRMTAGEPAALQKAMTERQARGACQTEMRGARESRSALRVKMQTCMNGKMNGN